MRFLQHVAASTIAAAQIAQGLDITINDTKSIDSALSTIAYGMVKYYQGNETGMIPGELGDPYYWWECGGKNKLCRVANETMLIAGLRQPCSILTSTIGTTLATRSTMPW